MEKPNTAMKLPIGYRFHPTDEELLVHYLRRKVFGVPLPASVIPEFDVFQTHPSNLPGDSKEKRYFFSRKWGNDSENYTSKRSAGSGSGSGSGYWKPMTKSRQIIASITNHVIGMRTSFIFYQKNHLSNSKTQWVMHEYRLLASKQVSKMKSEDWVVYRVFQRKRKPEKEGLIIPKPSSNTNRVQTTMEVRSDIMGPTPTHPSSPCYSGITTDEEPDSSYYNNNSFSYFGSCIN